MVEKLLRRIYENKKLFLGLRIISHIACISTVVVFCLIVIKILFTAPISALKICAIVGIPFVIVSFVRWLIDTPRPYEIYDFYNERPKKRDGLSFPSRHTFSAFAIATAIAPASPLIAVILGFLGILLAISRVLCGIHFIKDVIAGALLGISGSLIGLLILFPY